MQRTRAWTRSHRGAVGGMRIVALVALMGVVVSACAPAAPSPQAPTTAPAANPTPAAKPTSPPVAATTKPAIAASPAASPAAAKPVASPAASPVAATAASPSPAASGRTISLPRPEKTSIKLGFSALEAIMTTYAMAQDQGLFRKYGFENVELLYTEGDAKALQSLISGGVDGTAQGPTVAIAALATDVPLVTVAMSATIITDDIFATPDVKSAADLKGKKIAISAFGGTSHASVLLGLRALGLTPDDVTIVQIGGESARVAALTSGSVQAAPMEIFRRQDMQQRGFNLLVSVAETPNLEFIRNGLNFRREFVQQNPNTVLALVAALLEAQQQLYSQTDKAIDAYAKFAQITDRADAERRVRSLLPFFRRDMRWSQQAWEFARDVMATQNDALKSVDVTKAYSFEFLDRLRAMGFNQAVGVPGS